MSFHIKELDEKSRLRLKNIYRAMDEYYHQGLSDRSVNIIEEGNALFEFSPVFFEKKFYLTENNLKKVFNYIKREYEKRGWLVTLDPKEESYRYIKFAIQRDKK